MNISVLKHKIYAEIQQNPVPRNKIARFRAYEATIKRYSPLLPHSEQDWLSRTAANHFRI